MLKRCLMMISLTVLVNVSQADIVHKFKNPSFSGVGTGAHFLTIENQEFSRKKAIEEALGMDLGSQQGNEKDHSKSDAGTCKSNYAKTSVPPPVGSSKSVLLRRTLPGDLPP